MFIQAKTLLTKKLNYDHHHHHHDVENEKKMFPGAKLIRFQYIWPMCVDIHHHHHHHHCTNTQINELQSNISNNNNNNNKRIFHHNNKHRLKVLGHCNFYYAEKKSSFENETSNF